MDLIEALKSAGLGEEKAKEHAEKLNDVVWLSVFDRIITEKNISFNDKEILDVDIKEVFEKCDPEYLKKVMTEETEKITTEYLNKLL